MRKPMAWTVVGIVLVVAELSLVKFTQIRAAIKAGSSWQPPPETVTTVVASVQDWSATIEAVGSAVPARGVTLAADLPGVVQSISFQSGAYVQEGQELVELVASDSEPDGHFRSRTPNAGALRGVVP